ncbi:ATP-dependent helicase [Ligilactobacillus salitolerans]|uniref:3'-5' exonuclease DinG n=1 Tax=Ligilactobacillus salitolerans TaxID=1808352 RepID=A0A401IU98_9LACO|nr:helicase C-terminal domain-containing protein [Ligilactobacillus salitolerans]GBG95096.1 ATP-dependent helicase [Ligilactobacillus salitolerans]
MSSKKIYAVVDLETTGTAINGTNRIIQFSCAFIENQQVVNEFSTLVDPKQPIPAEISHLTGIFDRDVKEAPSFEEVAGTIYALLQNTIFVAHNIAFDYNFLNSELTRVGYPELGLKGIDTVQLAQVVLPTLPSYRLSDISRVLHLEHERPHNAASDAQTTAELFIELQKKIAELPVGVLEQLVRMGRKMEFETVDCFKKEFRKKKQQEYTLPSELITVAGIVLQRPVFEQETLAPLEYPRTVQEKQKLFAHEIEWRKQQATMMDQIADFFESEQHVALIDAPTGMGKTLGYLFPAAYQTGQKKQVVISTATTALQAQLEERGFTLLKKLLPFGCSYVSLKGNHHFIDLDRFYRSLYQPQNAHTVLLQMRILVWLTQTKTGDFDELHLTKIQDPIFAEIQHHGIEGLNQESPFYAVDFLRQKRATEQKADFLLTNHAYLSQHVLELSGPNSILIVDEAQHLPEMTRSSNKQTIDFDEIKILADSLLVKIESKESYSFAELVKNQIISAASYHKVLRLIRQIDSRVPQLRAEFLHAFLKNGQRNEKNYEQLVAPAKLRGFIKAHLEEFVVVKNSAAALLNLDQEIYREYIQQAEGGHLSSVQSKLLNDYFTLVDALQAALKNWPIFSLDRLEQAGDNQLIWLTKSAFKEAHLRLNVGLMTTEGFLQKQIYAHFEHVLLTGAGLALEGMEQYVCSSLDLAPATVFSVYDAPFDYGQQVKAIIAKDAPDVGAVAYSDYCAYLAQAIGEICQQVQRQTLVLFNSLQTIQDVYRLLQENGQLSKRTLLAQGISGGVEKIRKRFLMDRDHQAILLGTGSFWEGIDLPQDDLELLLITRLPFQPVETIVNQARYQAAEREGQNPFSTIALPEAVSKLNQGFGRLIRTPQDQGGFVLLDSRILHKKYGVVFEKSFPVGLKLERLATGSISANLQSFFKNVPKKL